jgi:phosphoglycolate phosphatase/putative hydrolase of the HAD superfamily
VSEARGQVRLGHHLVRGVLFDVDGTLYFQPPLRLLMALELSLLALRVGPRRAGRIWALLRAYRDAHEILRRTGYSGGPIHDHQLGLAATQAGLSLREAAPIVSEWMVRRPLKYLRLCRRPGLVRLLETLRRRGVRLGVLSDYPAEAKLSALGLRGAFHDVVWTGEADVNALKPDPKGFLLVASRWNIPPSEALYVGDRADVDADGARRAGMPCVLVAARPRAQGTVTLPGRWRPAFVRLERMLTDE